MQRRREREEARDCIHLNPVQDLNVVHVNSGIVPYLLSAPDV